MSFINKTNLITLRNYLNSLPEDYTLLDMGAYAKEPPCPSVITEGPCENPTDALGHGPSAGVSILPYIKYGDIETLEIDNIKWDTYSYEKFGLTAGSEDWEFVFGSFWPNSIESTVERLDKLIDLEAAPEWFVQNASAFYAANAIEVEDLYTALNV